MKKRILLCIMAFVLVIQTACGSKATSESSPIKEAAEKVGILKEAKALDDEGVLWEIPNKEISKSFAIEDIQFFQGNLLVTTYDELILISMETGETLHQASLETYTIPKIQVCGDKIAISESFTTSAFKILDSELQEVEEYTFEEEYDGIYLNSDATKVFCYQSYGSLILKDLATGEQEILVEEIEMLDFNLDTVFNDLENGGVRMLDLENSSVKELPVMAQGYLEDYKGDKWLASDMNDINTHYIGNAKKYYSYETEDVFDTDIALVDGPASIYVSDTDDEGAQTIALYDMDGTLISQHSFTSSSVWVHSPLWSEEAGGYFMVRTKHYLFAPATSLLFWDPQVPTGGENLEVTLEYAYDAETDEQGMQLCHEKVAEISQKYGVEIKIGTECETDFKSYQAAQELRPEKIHLALHTLNKALSLYPDGFISQLTYGDQKVIEISFVGPLTTLTQGEYEAAAFVSGRKGKNILVADITSPNLEQTFYHEIMHLIDRRFEYDTEMGLSTVYNEDAWKALNPEEFEYFNSYKKITDQADINYMHSYFDWFVDGYGMTYTLEDRARIMENAAIGNDYVFEDHPYLVAKLEYLCQYIRVGFDTTGWPEKTVWEETLERCR